MSAYSPEPTAGEPTPTEPVGTPLSSVARKAGRGLRWSLIGNIATKLGSFATGLVLARLLEPADFGLFAVAVAATYFMMHVNDMGLIAAAVQWRGRFEDMAGTATVLAVAFSVTMYAICWIAAPAFAELAGAEGATSLVRLLTSVILIDGVTAIRVAALQRHFEQDKLVTANLAGLLVQAVLSVTLAVHGAGPFSFAVGQVGGSLMTGMLVLVFARVPFTIAVDRRIAAKLLRFGIPLAASLAIEAVLTNADYVIVGRLLGPTALGFYLLAFNVSGWVPGVVGTAVRYVSIAGFSRLAEEAGALVAGVQRTIPLLVGLVLPIGVIMSVSAPNLLTVLYGPAWLPSAEVLRFLVVLMVARMVGGFTFDILTGAGAIWNAVLLTFGWMLALVPALILGTHSGGIEGTAIAHALVASLVAIPLVAFSLRRIGVPLSGIGRAVLRPLLAAVCSFAACVLVSRVVAYPPVVGLLLVGAVGMVVYLPLALDPSQRRRLVAEAQKRLEGRRAQVRCGEGAE